MRALRFLDFLLGLHVEPSQLLLSAHPGFEDVSDGPAEQNEQEPEPEDEKDNLKSRHQPSIGLTVLQ
jgi:hypothetical protein